MSETFTITKTYRIFQGQPVGEPMDEMSEDQLYGWLGSRGCSEEEASALVEELGSENSIQIDFPEQSGVGFGAASPRQEPVPN